GFNGELDCTLEYGDRVVTGEVERADGVQRKVRLHEVGGGVVEGQDGRQRELAERLVRIDVPARLDDRRQLRVNLVAVPRDDRTAQFNERRRADVRRAVATARHGNLCERGSGDEQREKGQIPEAHWLLFPGHADLLFDLRQHVID